MAQVSEKNLRAEVDEIRERYPKLKDDDLFAAWFMKCFATESEAEAVNALVGGPKDKNLDAIHIDRRADKVFVVQGKYRQTPSRVAEKRNDVLALAGLGKCFSNDEEFRQFCEGLAPAARGKVEEARGDGVASCLLTS